MPLAMRLTGQVNASALARALVALIARHEALRTAIVEDNDGTPVGYLLPIPSVQTILPSADWQALDPQTRQAQTTLAIEQEAGKPFDLARDLSLRAKLIYLQANEALFLLTLHHQAGDGVSMGILTQELNLAYSAYCQNQEPAWAP